MTDRNGTPLFMDMHDIEDGVSASDVAGAHQADLATQGAPRVNYLRWFITTLTGAVLWFFATTTTAFALRPDPPLLGSTKRAAVSPQTPIWEFILVAGMAALLTVAVVFLIASIRNSRPSRSSQVLHA